MTLSRFALLALVAAALAGCGVRGSLDAPQASTADTNQTASADSGQGKKQGDAAKPHKGSFLDGLLR